MPRSFGGKEATKAEINVFCNLMVIIIVTKGQIMIYRIIPLFFSVIPGISARLKEAGLFPDHARICKHPQHVHTQDEIR